MKLFPIHTARNRCRNHYIKILKIQAAGLLFILLLTITACQKTVEITPTAEPTASPQSEPLPVQNTPTLPPSNPRVIQTRPENGSIVPLNGNFIIIFNQAMAENSVESAFNMEPEIMGDFTWLDDQTLQFTPDQDLALDSHYTIRVGSEAQSTSGRQMTEKQEFNFQTITALQMSEAYPPTDSVDIKANDAIWAAFNQPVVDLTNANLPDAFSLQPEVPGAGRWATDSLYIFYPSSALLGATEYTVKFNKNLTTSSGSYYDKIPTDIKFITEPPKIINFIPPEQPKANERSVFQISFNQPMSQESVESNILLINKKGQRQDIEFEWLNEDTLVEIHPLEVLERDETYTLTLSQSAKSKGGISLPTDFSEIFNTLPVLKISSFPDTNLAVSYNGYAELIFTFNLPLNPDQDFISLIDIRTYTPGNLQAQLSSDGLTLTYSGFFRPVNFYSYSLSPDLQDTWGRSLGTGVFKRFATNAPPTTLKIQGLDTDAPILFVPIQDIGLPAETTNVRRVDFQSAPLTIDEFAMLAEANQATRYAWQPIFDRAWYAIISPYLINAALPTELSLAPLNKKLEPGLYYYTVSSTEFKDGRNPTVFLTIAAQVHLTTKRSQDQILIWAVDLLTNETIPNAPVILYDSNGQIVDGGNTDARGILILDIPQAMQDDPNFYAAMYQPGHASFGFAMIDENNDLATDPAVDGVFVTDRPMYLPGEQLKFELFLQIPSNYVAPELIQIQLTLLNDQEMIPVQDQFLEMSTSNTLRGSFNLPEELPAGNYRLVLPDLLISHDFQIGSEDQKQATLTVDFANVNSPNFGEPLDAAFTLVNASGTPLENVPLRWQITANWLKLPLNNAASTLETVGLQDFAHHSLPPQEIIEIGQGECVSNPQGQCVVNLNDLPGFELLNKAYSYEFTFSGSAEFPDSIGTVSLHKSVLVAPELYSIRILQENWGTDAGLEQGFQIHTVFDNGQEFADVSLDAVFQKINPRLETISQNGQDQSQTVLEYQQISSTSFYTDANGFARLLFTPPDPGVYRLLIKGGNAASDLWLWVGGEGSANWLSDDQGKLLLSSNQFTYISGDSAKIFIPNPFNSSATALITLETETFQREQIMTIEGSGDILTIPLKELTAPGVMVSVTLHGLSADGLPAVRQAHMEIDIVDPGQTLLFSVEPTLKVEEGILRLKINTTINDAQSAPAVSQITLIALPVEWLNDVDQTLSAEVMPSEIYHQISTNTPMDQYVRVFSPVELTVYDITESMLNPPLPAIPTLSKKEAIWIADFTTDAEGLVYVEFPVDPAYSEYRIMMLGTGSNGEFGSTALSVSTAPQEKLDLLTPTFYRLGDIIMLQAVVHDPALAQQTVALALSGTGFSFAENEESQKSLEMDETGQQVASWQIIIDAKTMVGFDLTLTTTSETLIISEKVKIISNDQNRLTSGMISNPAQQWVQIDPFITGNSFSDEDWSISLYPGLESRLLDKALSLIEQPDHNLIEPVISKILVYAAVQRSVQLNGWTIPELEIIKSNVTGQYLQFLQNAQNDDGGWSFTTGGESDAFLTAYALYAFLELEVAEVDLDPTLLDHAMAFLEGDLPSNENITAADYDTAALFDYLRVQSGKDALYTEILANNTESASTFTNAFVLRSLIESGIGSDQLAWIAQNIKTDVEIGEFGNYWSAFDTNLLVSSDVSTAAALIGLAAYDPQNEVVSSAATHLSINHVGDILDQAITQNSWPNLFAEAWVIHALLQQPVSANTDYLYRVNLNDLMLLEAKAETNSITPENLTITADQWRIQEDHWLSFIHQEGEGVLFFDILQVQPITGIEKQVKRDVITITRAYQSLDNACRPGNCSVEDTFSINSEQSPIQVRLTVTMSAQQDHVLISDYIPAGATPVQPDTLEWFMAEDMSNPLQTGLNSEYFTLTNMSDDSITWYIESVAPGTYILTYYLIPEYPGEFMVPPADAHLLYEPLRNANTAGNILIFNSNGEE